MKMLAFVILLLGCVSVPPRPSLSSPPEYGTWESVAPTEADAVILIPQWHLAPQTNTRQQKNDLPQARNQWAIYKELSIWIESRDLQDLVVEGCEGELDNTADTSFNGWSLNELRQVPKDSSFDEIQTQIGIKIHAKYPDQIPVICGDNLKLIQQNQLALSDIRGLVGFKMRMEQAHLKPADRENFLQGLNAVLKLPPGTKNETALIKLNEELKKSVDAFEQKIRDRNDIFVEKLKSLKGRRVVVIGALHIPDLKSKLISQHIPVAVWRPVGLNDGDANLIEQLQKMIQLGPH